MIDYLITLLENTDFRKNLIIVTTCVFAVSYIIAVCSRFKKMVFTTCISCIIMIIAIASCGPFAARDLKSAIIVENEARQDELTDTLVTYAGGQKNIDNIKKNLTGMGIATADIKHPDTLIDKLFGQIEDMVNQQY